MQVICIKGSRKQTQTPFIKAKNVDFNIFLYIFSSFSTSFTVPEEGFRFPPSAALCSNPFYISLFRSFKVPPVPEEERFRFPPPLFVQPLLIYFSSVPSKFNPSQKKDSIPSAGLCSNPFYIFFFRPFKFHPSQKKQSFDSLPAATNLLPSPVMLFRGKYLTEGESFQEAAEEEEDEDL